MPVDLPEYQYCDKSLLHESAALIREIPKLRKERIRLGLFVVSFDRFNAILVPHWQTLCDPEIRELAIMPKIGGECSAT